MGRAAGKLSLLISDMAHCHFIYRALMSAFRQMELHQGVVTDVIIREGASSQHDTRMSRSTDEKEPPCGPWGLQGAGNKRSSHG
jgi:hypothetical protein